MTEDQASGTGHGAPGTTSGAKGSGSSQEDGFPKWLSIRLFIYLAGGHLFAAFLWLLFALGDK